MAWSRCVPASQRPCRASPRQPDCRATPRSCRRRANQQQHQHGGEQRPTLALIADHAAEGVGERRAQQRHQQHRQQIGQPPGFSNGCADWALKNPPPSPLSSLIASCEATGPREIAWCSAPSSEMLAIGPGQLLRHALPGHEQCGQHADRQQHVKNRPRVVSTQKLPIVVAARRAKPRVSASAAAIPAAADRKLCTAIPAICAR
jgi:hypothetical protein